MPTDKEDTFIGVIAEEHIREAERLKKAWFDHVIVTLEKLAENIDKTSSDLHAAKNELYKEIVRVRETLRAELKEFGAGVDKDLEKVEKRIYRVIDNINKSIGALSPQPIKDELKKDIESLRKEMEGEIKELKKETISPLEIDMVKLNTKIVVWSSIGGGIVSVALIFISLIARYYLFK
jgi:hypothetical protein